MQAYMVHRHVNKDDASFLVVRRSDAAAQRLLRKDRAVSIVEKEA